MKFVSPVLMLLGVSMLITTEVIEAQQAREPVQWTFRAVQTDDKFFEIHAVATLAESWHLPSQNAAPDAIAVPTKIHFPANPVVKFIGKPAEQGDLIVKRDTTLGSEERYYENEVIFIQPIKIKDLRTLLVIKGVVTYQVCTSEKCLPPKSLQFTVIVDNAK
jgi:hypothetical protein